MTRRIAQHPVYIILLALAACAPPPPVVLFVPPSISVDSTSVARRNVRLAPANRTFWEAMSGLDTGFVTRHQSTADQRAFARALGLIMSGRQEAAAESFDSLRRATSDTIVRAASRILVTAMLQYQDKWKALSELEPVRPASSGDSLDSSLRDRAGVESWARAFRGLAPRRISFPMTAAVVPLTLSPAGTPVIPVSVNGMLRYLWLDTGSSVSILSTALAAAAGVAPVDDDTLEIATTTGRVPAQPAVIERLDIGGISISSSPAMIVASELMEVRPGEGSISALPVKIDGVIGFDIMSRLDIRIDYANGRVTLLAPEAAAGRQGGRNLYWVGTPVVRMVTPKGIPLHFNLDTGAQETYSTDGLIARTRVRTFAGERRLIGGLAGLRITRGRFVDELRVSTAGQPVVLRKLLIFAPAFATFVSLDGVLGSDVGRGGVVRIDATNGLFLLEPAPDPRGLRPIS